MQEIDVRPRCEHTVAAEHVLPEHAVIERVSAVSRPLSYDWILVKCERPESEEESATACAIGSCVHAITHPYTIRT